MTHLLAQSGGSIPWNSPGFWKAAAIFIAILFSLLGTVFRKIQEKNAKKAAEVAKLRRQDDILRTGRDESGTFVDLSRPSPAAIPQPVDPRQKLQELAERRRLELAQMMERAKQSGSPAPRPARQAPPRNLLPVVGERTPAQMPASPTLGGRGPSERDVRRQREQQANKKAANAAAAAAKRKAQEPMRSPVPEQTPATSRPTSADTAYDLPKDRQPPTVTVSQKATASKVGAALARVAGGTSASEWRKAIVLSELLNRPVSLRRPDERVM